MHRQWVRYLLYAKEWSQADLAAEVKVHPSLVCRWIDGTRRPRERHWMALASLAGVDASEYWKGPPV